MLHFYCILNILSKKTVNCDRMVSVFKIKEKIMKKLFLLTAAAIVAAMLFTYAFAEGEISLFINGRKIDCDVPVQIVNDRTLCPTRAVFDAFGASVSWDGEKKQVTIKGGTDEISLTVGSNTAYVGTKSVTLDCAPVIISDRCMVPVRFIGETLGCKVEWEDKTKSVYIIKEENKNIYTVSDIKLAQNNDDKSVFQIKYNGEKEPDTSYLAYSDCIVMDFADTALAFADSKVTIDNTFVKEIRYAQHDSYARVVIECKGVQPYTKSFADGIFTVNVGSKSSAVTTPPSDNSTPSKPSDSDNPSAPSDTSNTLSDSEFTKTRDENNLCVVIDAGHGGKDPGAVYKNENGEIQLAEKDVNLTIANKVYDILKAEGINVKYTRNTDKFLELKEITDIANGYDADLFVSVHINAMENSPDISGMMVLYNGDATGSKYGINSKEVAVNIDKKIAAAVDIKDRGIVSRPGLWVLRKTNMPAVLIECAFISNEGDRAIMTDENALNAYARSISDGIKQSLETMKQNIIKAKNS